MLFNSAQIYTILRNVTNFARQILLTPRQYVPKLTMQHDDTPQKTHPPAGFGQEWRTEVPHGRGAPAHPAPEGDGLHGGTVGEARGLPGEVLPKRKILRQFPKIPRQFLKILRQFP